ncbi:MAG TPA: argininosuccinate lyase, partial [Ktedonobacteraceae bacterium]
LPFRDAYRIVGKEVTAQLDRQEAFPVETQEQLVARLHLRKHLGGPGNPGLELSEQRLAAVQKSWQQQAVQFTQAIQQLVGSSRIKILEES